jgi:hypothetical protein
LDTVDLPLFFEFFFVLPSTFCTSSVGTRILIFFVLDPKLVPKTGNLRCGNNKIREAG